MHFFRLIKLITVSSEKGNISYNADSYMYQYMQVLTFQYSI